MCVYLLVFRIHFSLCLCILAWYLNTLIPVCIVNRNILIPGCVHTCLILEYTDPCVCVPTCLVLEYTDPCVCAYLLVIRIH